MAGRLSRVCTKGLTVLVTGGTSGFGEATARRFIAEGSRVCKPCFMAYWHGSFKLKFMQQTQVKVLRHDAIYAGNRDGTTRGEASRA